MGASLSLKARDAAASVFAHVPPVGAGPFAEPPPGSGLRPVMGEPGLPLVGHSLSVVNRPLEMSRRFYARYGPIAWTSVVGKRIVSVGCPEGVERVLTNSDRSFGNERGWEYFIGPFFHRGVMLMDFEEHRHHRRIMQEAFKRERLVSYLDAMNAVIGRGIDNWPEGRGFELYPQTKQLTLDVATRVFVGAELGHQADRLNEAFVSAVNGGQAVVRADLPGGRWHRGLQGRRLLEDYFASQIPSKRAGDGDDLFSVLCHAETEDGERFSDDDVVNHMIFTMMAAHDTSTITVAMMSYYLARHPEWQARIREESRALGKPAIGYDDLEALPSLDLAFRETLRMNAPVGMLARQALKDTEICGRYIPEGTTVSLALHAMMRGEPYWPDPDVFDPERFSPERAEDQPHKYAWVPFGGGVHKCIGMHFGGMEVKAIMHQLLLRHSLHIDPGYEPMMDFGTGPYPGDGLPIELRRCR
jgi:cytochrome P450